MSARWDGVEVSRLQAGHLRALLSGRAAFVRVPAFLEPGRCVRLTERFLNGRPRVWQARDYGDVRVRELGLMFAPHSREPGGYFGRVAAARARLRRFYGPGSAPAGALQRLLEQATGWRREPLCEGKRPYLSEFVWAFPPRTGVPLHHDGYMKGLDFAPNRFPAHLTWNVYLSLPETGAPLRIYRRVFREGDEALERGQHSFDPALTKGRPAAECAPRAGDLVLFDASHFHEVDAAPSESWRVSAHGFLSVDDRSGRFAFWI